MADTRPEMHRICNLKPSRDTDRDWTVEHARAANAIKAPSASLPQDRDLRESWWNIGDQERTGSCVGWAAADGIARYHMVKSGKIPKPGHLSPRYVWMASKETDENTTRPETFIEEAGTSLKAAVDILRNYGVVPEEMLPFHIVTNMYIGDVQNPEDAEEVFYATAATRRIASYFNMRRDFSSWRNWLVAHGPILVGLHVDETWDNATATRGNLDVFRANTVRGGHAVCIVGYTKDNRFILRNSWGTKWGDNGFAYASEAYINAAFFNESYGVTV